MIKGHENAVLQFSGGRDSLACLYLLKPYWEELTVAWCYTHDAFQETIDQMREVAGWVKRFEIVHSDVVRQNERLGPPSDLVPVWDTELGRSFASDRKHRVQTPFSCCNENIWEPMTAAMKKLGATLVIRGQRNSEKHKSPMRSGHVEDGVEYYFPLESWQEWEVTRFLDEEKVPLPAHYKSFNSSLDCAGCTAYLAENHGKLGWMQETHPELAKKLVHKLEYVQNAVQGELFHLTRTLQEQYA